MGRVLFSFVPALLAMYVPFCTGEVRATLQPSNRPPITLWQQPADIAAADLYTGPWGPGRAPDPAVLYTLVERKHAGTNPGLTVRDPNGRVWHVKQALTEGRRDEGPIEVFVSRVLSAVGYHQPPVYYLPKFTLSDGARIRVERGGRFRLKEHDLKALGEWSWQRNPFVDTPEYQGLLAILLLFNSTDLKNSNNVVYEYHHHGTVEHWYVVRDLGSALGETGHFAPTAGNPDLFARSPFILGVRDGFVQFGYSGWHQELWRGRMTPADITWAVNLVGRLSDRQWRDAFRAGGFAPEVASRFLDTIHTRLADAREVHHATAAGE